jgi:hypothetical protein
MSTQLKLNITPRRPMLASKTSKRDTHKMTPRMMRQTIGALTQSLASSINEKRNSAIKMRSERMNIQREMKKEKKR